MNFIYANREALGKRHYIIKANHKRYWSNFTPNRLQQYVDRYNDDFCLIATRDSDNVDAYVFPYSETKEMFTSSLLCNNAWNLWIDHNTARFKGHEATFNVSNFYNAICYVVDANAGLMHLSDDITQHTIDDIVGLKEAIRTYNDKYQCSIPSVKLRITQVIERPGIITDHIKQLCNYRCQLCGNEGFRQQNGTRYVEAHHIMELHTSFPGSYCSDNIVILCANCHRKMHFAQVSVKPINEQMLQITINDEVYEFHRNIISK